MEATAASRLPFVDELSIEIAAGPEAVWETLLRTIERSFDSPRTGRVAQLLGCHDLESSGARPLAAGSTFPGFHIEAAEPGGELALAGGHRFSDYALTFRFDELDGVDLFTESGNFPWKYATAMITHRAAKTA